MKGLFHSARSMPEDKLEWVPLGEARTALDQVQECAIAPLIYLRVIDPHGTKGVADYQKARELRKELSTLEQCEAAANENCRLFCDQVLSLSDDDLMREVTMPWGAPGTVLQAASIPSWNFTYHLGAVNQIQRMYGDTDMH